MKLDEIYNEASNRLPLLKDTIKKIYVLYWKFIKAHIENLPLKTDLTEEQFKSLKTSINVPSIGKLYCSFDKYTKQRNLYKYAKTKKNSSFK